ncbi:MAG: hypothetical protein QGE94_06595 [Desulfobacterales bacterium]|jgi:hypothetical protein|nr:hypothetical protein [Desulfobacterales bacterium]
MRWCFFLKYLCPADHIEDRQIPPLRSTDVSLLLFGKQSMRVPINFLGAEIMNAGKMAVCQTFKNFDIFHKFELDYPYLL